MSDAIIKIKPLGGVGQIGSNMTIIEHEGMRILIDAGILFPYEDFFDIDYLIPDLSKVDTPDILLITHGHEDHIGAVYNIIKAFPEIKVFAPRFAAALIRKKLEFNKTPFPITVYQDEDVLTFGDLKVHPIHVNHSIPDTKGLFFTHEKLSMGLLFVSDFKIDFKTKFERPFDFEKLKKISQNLKTKILLADSTNINSSNLETPSEFDLIPSFEKIFSEATSRIFITLFASNIHRLKTIIDMAEKYQFKVVPYGRSMISYLNSATEEGIIPNPERVIQSSESIKKDMENVVVLLSGCQGDFLGTFRRVSLGEDALFKPKATDTFVISSKPIPGNEKKINMLLNRISEVGCKIITSSDLPIHVSGHPGKTDLTKLYNEYLPTDIVPIHGEVHFLREHIEHIKHTAPYAKSHFILNHDEIHINAQTELKIIAGEKLDPIIYHGNHIVIEKEKISERRKMACNGTVFFTGKIDTFKSKITTYQIDLLGIPTIIKNDNEHLNTFLKNEIANYDNKDPEKSKENLRVAIRRYFDHKLGYKPTTVVHVL